MNENEEIKLKMEEIINAVNLAEVLTEKELSYLGETAVDGYENDKYSRAEWEGKVEEWNRLTLQVKEPKTFPWPGAANVKYPLITNAALQYSSRAYPALVNGTNIVRGRVIGFDNDGSKLERAIRVGRHMSYQLLEQMDDWEEQMDRLLFALPILGCMFKKTYYDAVRQKNVSEVVYPSELVVNYYATTLEDAPRITHVLKMSSNDIYERTMSGVYVEQDLEKPLQDEAIRASDEAQGYTPPENADDTQPYEILEQCCYYDLDGDGYAEPYIVTVDSVSRKVLRVVARFSEDSLVYNNEGDIVRIEPDHYYTKYSFIPSTDGSFYDIGFGILLGPINDTVNTLINQLLDAGSLNNMQGGFISRGIRVKNGQRPFTLGEWKYVNSAGDDLRKGIIPLPTKEPSNVLFQMLNMMISVGEKISSSTEMMSGQIPGQNTKATVAMAAIDQGMKVFMSIHKRVHRSLAKEYKKLYKLNSMYLPMQDYFTVLDLGQEQAAMIGNSDYDIDNIDIAPASDPNVATEEQRMSKVQALFELVQMGTVNPQEVTKRYLVATEQPNIETLMEMPQQGPSPEELQIEFEKAKFEEESSQKWEDLAIRRISAESAALKNIADAEAAEEGDQLAEYQQILGMQQQNDLAGMKSQQAAQEFKRKQNEQGMQHQQKMQQSNDMHQQKMQQQGVNGDGSTGTSGSNG